MTDFINEIKEQEYKNPEYMSQLKHYMEQSLWSLRKDIKKPGRSKNELEVLRISIISLLESQAKKTGDESLQRYLCSYTKRVEELFDKYL